MKIIVKKQNANGGRFDRLDVSIEFEGNMCANWVREMDQFILYLQKKRAAAGEENGFELIPWTECRRFLIPADAAEITTEL